MKKGWAAGAPEFGKLIVPSVAFWAGAGDATSQHTTPSNTEAPAERRRVSIGARQPLNFDLTLTLAMRTSFTTCLHRPKNPGNARHRVWNDDDITVAAWLLVAQGDDWIHASPASGSTLR